MLRMVPEHPEHLLYFTINSCLHSTFWSVLCLYIWVGGIKGIVAWTRFNFIRSLKKTLKHPKPWMKVVTNIFYPAYQTASVEWNPLTEKRNCSARFRLFVERRRVVCLLLAEGVDDSQGRKYKWCTMGLLLQITPSTCSSLNTKPWWLLYLHFFCITYLVFCFCALIFNQLVMKSVLDEGDR